MKPTFFILLLAATFTFVSEKSSGQSGIMGDSIKSMLVKDWERGKAYTQDYMKAMPSDKYSFKATDSVRTFAEQLLHLAQVNLFLVSTGTGEKPPSTGGDIEKRASAQTADSVMYFVNSSYDYAINSINKMPGSTLMQTVTVKMGSNVTVTRLGWLLKAFEHQTHHRGQTTVYLRLAGIRPPNERLF